MENSDGEIKDKVTENEELKRLVRERYAEIVMQSPHSCCGPQTAHPAGCGCSESCGETPNLAAMLYTQEELRNLPDSAVSVFLGCGNPLDTAELKPGETVLDLGSGGGLDCLLAAQRVGTTGRVIGVDMTLEMIHLARENAKNMQMENVEFRLGEMEYLPLESNSVDVVISNCVINLSPDKDAVLKEAYRVLKPGGRLCISDTATIGKLPQEVRESLEMWAECIGGALERDVYLDKIRAAGFTVVSSSDIELEQIEKESRLISLAVKAIKPG